MKKCLIILVALIFLRLLREGGSSATKDEDYFISNAVSSDRNNYFNSDVESNAESFVSIRKCCPPNKFLNIAQQKWNCRLHFENSSWNPVLYSQPEKKLGESRNITFETVGFPNCRWTALNNKLDKWFNILEDGNVVVGLNFWTIPLWLKPSNSLGYCVDALESLNNSDVNNEANYVLVFCELESFGAYLAIRTTFGVLFMLSAASVLSTLIIYLLLWSDQSIHGWTQFSFFLSLFLFVTFEGSRILAKLNGLKIVPTTMCFVHAILAHYFTVVLSGTSCMMCLDCFVTFWKLRSVRSKPKREMVIYLFLAWGIPLLALVVGLILHFTNNPEEAAKHAAGVFEYAHYRCSSPIWEFAFRVQLLMLIVNLLAFIGTGYFIISHFRSTQMINSKRKNKFKKALSLFFKLFSITGLSWTLTAIDLFWGYKNPMGWAFVLIRVCTTLQGLVYLFIFGIHRKNFTLLRKKFPMLDNSYVASWIFGSTADRQKSNIISATDSNGRTQPTSSVRSDTRTKSTKCTESAST